MILYTPVKIESSEIECSDQIECFALYVPYLKMAILILTLLSNT